MTIMMINDVKFESLYDYYMTEYLYVYLHMCVYQYMYVYKYMMLYMYIHVQSVSSPYSPCRVSVFTALYRKTSHTAWWKFGRLYVSGGGGHFQVVVSEAVATGANIGLKFPLLGYLSSRRTDGRKETAAPLPGPWSLVPGAWSLPAA